MNSWMERRQADLEAILKAGPVVAVVTIENADDAAPMARALVAGGVRAIEITLRTRAAIDAIRAVAENVPDALPGAGTVLTGQDFSNAERAGAKFAVSPGATPELLAAVEKSTLPYLPGSASASEVMWLLQHGYRQQKFFPAEPAGGIDYLRALSGPLPAVSFCPTGGIRVDNAAEYLKLPNVVCVGGSWLTPANLMKAKDWEAIAALARDAAKLRS